MECSMKAAPASIPPGVARICDSEVAKQDESLREGISVREVVVTAELTVVLRPGTASGKSP